MKQLELDNIEKNRSRVIVVVMILTMLGGFAGDSKAAGAVIEGIVFLSSAGGATTSVSAARYQATTKPGDPEELSAVVYLEGPGLSGLKADPSASAKVLQKAMQFRPAVLPVQVGTKVEFPNLDDLYHNVFSYSKAKRFDLGRYLKDEKQPTVVFEKPGAIKLFCEIHRHMRGTILVLDTPHFTRTKPDGSFRLEGMPEGKFKLTAWISSRMIRVQEIELKAGETVRVNFPGK